MSSYTVKAVTKNFVNTECYCTVIMFLFKVDPGYKYDQQFLPDQIHYAFQIDSRSNTRPISMNVSYPDEIQQMFDTITYYKGN